jgi:arsenate reductase
MQPDHDSLATMLKALGHPARLEMLKTLARDGEAGCLEIMRGVPLAQSTVSEHLRVLKEAGLVHQRSPSGRSAYRIDRGALVWLKQSVIALGEPVEEVSPVSKRVLFLCTGNSARSIIAEALLKDMGGPDFHVSSAGTDPRGIHPLTAKVLAMAGLDVSDSRSKHLSEFLEQQFDYVITVCDAAAERCPVFPGDPQRIHWSFADPAAVEGSEVEKLAAFQATLREMRNRLAPFIEVARRSTPARPPVR